MNTEEIAAERQAIVERLTANFAANVSEEIEAGRIKLNQFEDSSVIKSEFGRPEVASGRFGNIDSSAK